MENPGDIVDWNGPDNPLLQRLGNKLIGRSNGSTLTLRDNLQQLTKSRLKRAEVFLFDGDCDLQTLLTEQLLSRRS